MTPGVVASALGRLGRTPLIGYLAGPWHSPKALALPLILTPCHVALLTCLSSFSHLAVAFVALIRYLLFPSSLP